MKYLKLYEDISNEELKEIEKDIKDALIELEDIGFDISIRISKSSVPFEGYSHIIMKSKRVGGFYINKNIKNTINTMIDYISDLHPILFEKIEVGYKSNKHAYYKYINSIHEDKLIRVIKLNISVKN
jgi:hypothetical protein